MRERCQKWLEACARETRAGAGAILQCITTLRALSECREAAWELVVGAADERYGVNLSSLVPST